MSDRPGAGAQRRVISLGDHVVVVTVEGATRQAQSRGERVQLLIRPVADQMRPQSPVAGPHGWVDVDRHAVARPTASSIKVRQVRTRSAST